MNMSEYVKELESRPDMLVKCCLELFRVVRVGYRRGIKNMNKKRHKCK